MELRCPFAKVLLGGFRNCANAARTTEGEQTRVFCTSPAASRDCHALEQLLRERAVFALKLRHADEPLPFGKELRLLLGGLQGLERLQFPDDIAGVITDIRALVCATHARYDGWQSLPTDEIIRAIAACKPRSSKKKPPTL